MMKKRKLICGIVNTAERLARQTQEVSCAIDPNAEDAACRSTCAYAGAVDGTTLLALKSAGYPPSLFGNAILAVRALRTAGS